MKGKEIKHNYLFAMATESTAKSTKKASKKEIVDAYIDFKLTEGKEPASVYKFTKDLKLKESVFYDYFASFQDLESQIWATFCTEVIEELATDSAFAEMAAREKLLSFYYTFFTNMLNHRSYVLVSLKPSKNNFKQGLPPHYLKLLIKAFDSFVKTTIANAIEKGEIKSRPVVEERYEHLFHGQLLFLLNFWINDSSRGFEKTDEAIERSVNLLFESLAPGLLDTALDFAKFVWQNR